MNVIAKNQGWTRLGSGASARGPALICLTGAGESGKTRLACSANRAAPDWFGKRSVYIAVDPEAASLGSVLPADRQNMEVITLDANKDVASQVSSIYGYPWKSEGFDTIITDTMTVLSQIILAQVTNSGKFSDRHIELGDGIKQPMQGDFLATNTLVMSLLRKQLASNMNHITLFHEQEARPEPGQPGDPIGGPATVGKASIRSIVNWYNTVLHIVRRAKKRTQPLAPLEYERIVHTAGHGIWQAKLRTSDLTNPVPEIAMNADPVNVWTTLHELNAKENTNV
jgi:hypothetical protein